MDSAAAVARIKAEFAARGTAWTATIRARLAQGPATSRQLADACGCGLKGSFSGLLTALKRAGKVMAVGTTVNRTGSRVVLLAWVRESEAAEVELKRRPKT